MVKVYVHDNNDSTDFREKHDSGQSVDLQTLKSLGVIYYRYENPDDVETLAKERDYKNRDVVTITPDAFGGQEAYMKKLEMFYEEHLHEDEEIRYCLEGSGYFDVRHEQNHNWIRCQMEKGDLLIMPAGIYHRFTVTSENYIKALRLFKDEPKWNAISRPEGDALNIRKQYLKTIN